MPSRGQLPDKEPIEESRVQASHIFGQQSELELKQEFTNEEDAELQRYLDQLKEIFPEGTTSKDNKSA